MAFNTFCQAEECMHARSAALFIVFCFSCRVLEDGDMRSARVFCFSCGCGMDGGRSIYQMQCPEIMNLERMTRNSINATQPMASSKTCSKSRGREELALVDSKNTRIVRRKGGIYLSALLMLPLTSSIPLSLPSHHHQQAVLAALAPPHPSHQSWTRHHRRRKEDPCARTPSSSPHRPQSRKQPSQ